MKIKKDESVYTVESDFSDTCYDILYNDSVIDSVCTNDELVYETPDYAYGDYSIVQKSNGIGYRKDNNIYTVTINNSNQHPTVTLNNYLIRNNVEIKKFACRNNKCEEEEGAKFAIYDKNDSLVEELTTDNFGYVSKILGYGTYTIKQISGRDGYTLAPEYQEKILDEETSHYKELYNNYIEKRVEKKEEPKREEKVIKPKPEPEATPPATSVDDPDILVNSWNWNRNFLQYWLKLLKGI